MSGYYVFHQNKENLRVKHLEGASKLGDRRQAPRLPPIKTHHGS